MEHVLVEKLVNLRQYPVTLRFELPHDFPMTSRPEVTISLSGVRQLLRPDGLTLQGTLVQTICDRTDGNLQEWDEELYFTYLIPRQDLQKPDLLNFEVEVTVEQFQYHLFRKANQVFLCEVIELLVTLEEYHLLDTSHYRLGGIEKQTGIFLYQVGCVEERLLRLVPIQLPEDFALLVKTSGAVEGIKTDVTREGCIVEFVCRIHGEYVTTEQKVRTFFFEKNEYVFFPLEQAWCVPDCRVQPTIILADVSLEGLEELAVLFKISLQFYQERESDFFTGNPAELPPGVELKELEVEQIGQYLVESQLVTEQVELVQLKEVAEIRAVRGEFTGQNVEEAPDHLLVSGTVEWNCIYLDTAGRERSYHWTRRVDQLMTIPPGEGRWQVQAGVKVPVWELREEVVHFTGLIEYTAGRREKRIWPVLKSVPPELQGTEREKFLITEKVGSGQISLVGEEKVYLHRYAREIHQIDGQVTRIESRPVEGGWMVKGQGELVIYYLTGEGERHFCHPFRFYRYLPEAAQSAGSELRLQPEVRLLDEELLEDGSVVQVRYLLQIGYGLYRECQTELVTGLQPGPGRVRPVFQVGCVTERIEQLLEFADDWFFMNRIKGVDEVQLDWREYGVTLTPEGFEFSGELEARVRYRNRLGREKIRCLPVPVQIKRKITLEGACQEVRAVPLLKGFDYRLTEHPEIALSVSLELNYRLVGRFTSLYVRTLPSGSTP